MNVKESLKRFRKEYRLSQAQVATELGIRQQLYQYYESNNGLPAEKIVELAKKFGVSADYLLGLSDQPTPAAVPAPMVDDELAQAALAFAAVVQKKIKEQSVIEEGAE